VTRKVLYDESLNFFDDTYGQFHKTFFHRNLYSIGITSVKTYGSTPIAA
jgi:hypothetical protein